MQHKLDNATGYYVTLDGSFYYKEYSAFKVGDVVLREGKDYPEVIYHISLPGDGSYSTGYHLLPLEDAEDMITSNVSELNITICYENSCRLFKVMFQEPFVFEEVVYYRALPREHIKPKAPAISPLLKSNILQNFTRDEMSNNNVTVEKSLSAELCVRKVNETLQELIEGGSLDTPNADTYSIICKKLLKELYILSLDIKLTDTSISYDIYYMGGNFKQYTDNSVGRRKIHSHIGLHADKGNYPTFNCLKLYLDEKGREEPSKNTMSFALIGVDDLNSNEGYIPFEDCIEVFNAPIVDKYCETVLLSLDLNNLNSVIQCRKSFEKVRGHGMKVEDYLRFYIANLLNYIEYLLRTTTGDEVIVSCLIDKSNPNIITYKKS